MLLFLVSVCFGCAMYISKEVELTTSHLNQAVAAHQSGQHEEAERYLNLAADYWQTKLPGFATVLRHDAVDEVSREFERLRAYAASPDQDDFLSNCMALLSSLEHIRDLEWPYLHNIL